MPLAENVKNLLIVLGILIVGAILVVIIVSVSGTGLPIVKQIAEMISNFPKLFAGTGG